MPALRLTAPADWQQVGTRPEFKVSTRDDEARGEVLLFGRDDYVERGIERAARVASVRLEPAGVAGVLVGMPATPLPEGDYVVVLKESTGGVQSVSGVCIRDARERWPRRVPGDARGAGPVRGREARLREAAARRRAALFDYDGDLRRRTLVPRRPG